MEKEVLHFLKDEQELKELKDSNLNDNDLNENESDNSFEIQENDGPGYSTPEPNNIPFMEKFGIDKQILNNNIDSKEIIDKNEDEYIAVIEGLENELLIEQYITKALKNDSSFNEEMNKLKSELNNKNIKLEQLKLINKKQENTLIEVINKLKKEKNMNNKVIIHSGNNNLNLNLNNKIEISKNEAINNALKIKDSILINVINKMNSLKKENEDLKKKISQNENTFNCSYNNKNNNEEFSQKNLEKIKFLQNEIKLLNKQLIEHNKCIEEQNTVNKEYNNLKNELKLLKTNNQDIQNKIKDVEKKILNFDIDDINNSSIINYNNNNLSFKQNKISGINPPTKRQLSVKNKAFSRTTQNSEKQYLFPILSIQSIFPNNNNYFSNNYNKNINKSILSDDFLKKIKKYFSNKNEYFSFINKINNIEKKGNNDFNENTTFRKLRKYNTHIGNLDKKKLSNFEGKGIDNKIKMMNYKLNTLKDENTLQNKKIDELQYYLNNIKNEEKEKDNEIEILISKINSVKNELKIKDE